jgi:hypothetical protein
MSKKKQVKRHKVKAHIWKKGKLQVSESVFDSLEQAMNFINYIYADDIKIYNDQDELVHSHTPVNNSYA